MSDTSTSEPPSPNSASPLPPNTTIIVQIPDCPALPTTLSAYELGYIFPSLHIYMDEDMPLVAMLPSSCITYRGLRMALSWHEQSFGDPNIEFCATFPELVEVYQVMMFLGGSPSKNSNIEFIKSTIIQRIEDGLTIEEVQGLMNMKFLPFIKPFLRLMIKMILDMHRSINDIRAHPALYAVIEADLEAFEEFKNQLAVVEWAEADEEVWDCVETLQEEEAKEARKCKRETQMRKRYGYCKKRSKGYSFIAKSAVECAKKMEVLWEHLDEDAWADDAEMVDA